MAASSPGSEKKKLLSDWVTHLDEANNKRQWGQIVEAAEQYTRITRRMRTRIIEDSHIFNDHEKHYLEQARRDIHQETVSLHDFTLSKDNQGVKIDQIRQVLLSMKLGQLPADVEQIKEDGVPSLASHTHLNIVIERIGIKNASTFCQPFIKVYALTVHGEMIEETYETPYSSNFERDYILFNSEPIRIKTPLDQLPTGCAIFFELHHYKHSKRKTSNKCFTFMEQDEFKRGPAALEIYKKPTDVTRTKLTLLTQKKMYLNLNLSFSQEPNVVLRKI